MNAFKEKKASFWVALAVPFAFIAIILVKIVMTYQAGKATHLQNNTIFTLDEFMQEHKIEGLIDTPRERVEYAKVNSEITAIINQSIDNKRKKIGPYGWIAFSRKNNQDDQTWSVIFRETGVTPYSYCVIKIQGELVGRLNCKKMSAKS